jgi:hypothetical protein
MTQRKEYKREEKLREATRYLSSAMAFSTSTFGITPFSTATLGTKAFGITSPSSMNS